MSQTKPRLKIKQAAEALKQIPPHLRVKVLRELARRKRAAQAKASA